MLIKWTVRWFVEICAVSKVSKKEIGRVFKLILKNLETSVELITTGDFMVCRNNVTHICWFGFSGNALVLISVVTLRRAG